MKKAAFWGLNIGMAILLPIFFCFFASVLWAQTPARITIEEAWQRAKESYPLIRQKALLRSTRDYTVDNAAKGYWPVLSVTGQATYQSTVTSFPFNLPVAGFKTPVYSKDQYRLVAEASQLLYDGGLINYQKQIADATEQVGQQSLEVQLYALYDRVNQLFFGALLLNEQLKQNALLQQNIQNGIEKTKALVANGVALKSSVDELSAQALQTTQAAVELQAMKKAYLNMLSLFLNTTLSENTELAMPSAPNLQPSLRRPELLLYEAQIQQNDLQRQLLRIQLRPRFNFFLQGGYGRPGLNVLSNDFAAYYIAGIRAAWNLGSLYTLKNQQRLIALTNENIDVQKQTFLFNTHLQLQQQNEEVKKFAALLRTDDDIIALRQRVKQTAEAQLENGVLSAHDYLTQVIAEDGARQNRILHLVQLLQAQYNYQNITGQRVTNE